MRLIDADDLAAKIMMEAPGFLDGGSEITKAFIMAMIKTRSVTPTIDAVHVVRCKDCKHYKDYCCTNENYPKGRSPEWYCADGKQ